jgi:PilZ domain-containing protein
MDTQEKRRGQCRYIRHDKLFVQVLAANEKHDARSVTVLCHSCDASINGLKIELLLELEVNTQIDLWLAFEGVNRKFYLRGHVCWCEGLENEPDVFQTGIELEDANATDYAGWIELLENFSE